MQMKNGLAFFLCPMANQRLCLKAETLIHNLKCDRGLLYESLRSDIILRRGGLQKEVQQFCGILNGDLTVIVKIGSYEVLFCQCDFITDIFCCDPAQENSVGG